MKLPSISLFAAAVTAFAAPSFGAPLFASPPILKSVNAESIQIGRNLIEDGSFEQIGANGVPEGWSWSARNTSALFSASADTHSGKSAVKIANTTAFGADVYGMFWKNAPIALIPGHSYTLSAWTKSTDPGIAWIGGGVGWQYRLPLPKTGGAWKRVAYTFKANADDASFFLRVCTENETPGFLLDDVKLEEGEEATPFVTRSGAASLTPLNGEQEVEGDGSFHSDFVLYAPDGFNGTASAVLGQGAPVQKALKLARGAWRIRVNGESESTDDAARKITLRLSSDSDPVLSSDLELKIFSGSGGRQRAERIAAALPELKKRIDLLKQHGQDISYPMVSYTVLANFVRYSVEDIEHGEVRRGLMQLGDLEPMLERCRAQVDKAEHGARLPNVYHYDGKPIEVSHSSFVHAGSAPSLLPPRPVFFTGHGAFGQVRADIEKFPSYGVNIIQIEIGPSAVFPKEGVVEMGPIQEMQGLLKRAAASGVALNLLISPHYFPEWALDKYPELRKKREGFLAYCLHAPEGKALLQRFLNVLIPAVKEYPALHSICLSNEPVNVEEPCEYAAKEFHDYLRATHGTIDQLNKDWGTQHRSIDTIDLPDPFKAFEALPAGERHDYLEYNRRFFAGWHRMLADTIHKLAPKLPVHAKAMTWTMVSGQEARFGVDAEQFGAFSEINGNDSANMYDYGSGEFAQGWEMNALDHDLQRSVRDAPVFNSENHIIPDRDTRYVPAEHVYTALWQAAIHGQSATAIWVWERTFDPKSDIAGSIMHRPGCAEAVGRVNCDLNRAAIEVTSIQRAKPDVTILFSNTARDLDPTRFSDSLFKAYDALTFRGLRPGFITEDMLARGAAPKTKLVFIPSTVHLLAGTLKSLTAAGSVIVFVGADSDESSRDQYGRPVARPQGVETLNYHYGKSKWQDLFAALPPVMMKHGALPVVKLVSEDGKPVTGVEWRTAHRANGLVINLVNYRKTSQRVRFEGLKGTATDLLTGTALPLVIELAPLQPLLVKVGGM